MPVAPRRIAAGLALAAAGLALAGGYPTSTHAGGGLTASSPADRAALATAPTAVRLTFSAVPTVALSHVIVLDEAGSPVNSGALARHGDTLAQPVRIRARGNHTVAYHVVFDDGSDAHGTLRFSVGTGVPPPPLEPQAHQAAEATVARHEHSVDPMSAILLLADAAVGLGVLALLYRRRPGRRRPG